MSTRALLRIRYFIPAVALCLVAARRGAPAGHEIKFEVDPLSSIAWWQVLPHLNRLWASTCPEERSWLPPAGHDAGGEDASDIGKTTWKVQDSSQVPIPLLPRYRVRPVCSKKAVHGELIASDTTTWTGAHGEVAVDAAALTQGQAWDDEYAHTAVYNVMRFPEIVLHVDSLTQVTSANDTIHAVAVGTFSLHGVDQPISVHVIAWHDAGGIRVKGRWFIPAKDLVEVYQFSRMKLGLGVGMSIWKQFWMGIDMVMRPEPATS